MSAHPVESSARYARGPLEDLPCWWQPCRQFGGEPGDLHALPDQASRIGPQIQHQGLHALASQAVHGTLSSSRRSRSCGAALRSPRRRGTPGEAAGTWTAVRVILRTTGRSEPIGRTRTVTAAPPSRIASSTLPASQLGALPSTARISSPGFSPTSPPNPHPDSAGPFTPLRLGAGHLTLVFAVALPDQQLGVGIVQGGDQRVGGAGRGRLHPSVDVVAVDRADHVLEQPCW